LESINRNQNNLFLKKDKNMKKEIHTNNAPQPIGPYSQAIMAKGSFLFLSGQIPLMADGNVVDGGINEQTKQVMENIKAVLAEAGLTFENIVKTTIFLSDMANFGTVNTIYGEYFKETPPARSAFQVARLPKDVLVEIESIAVINE
jgi:2-iminobutanoate/2-iminopropanoate deaminase